MDNYYKNNQSLWNQKTAVHKDSEFYGLNDFKKGKSSLMPTEIQELGDVKGKTLLHLQCHFGMDSLSWARAGAKVTAVDFAEDAITLARSLNDELEQDVRFIQSNIYDLPNVLDEQFDIVFTSYGVLCWLGDLKAWAALINKYLKPGGTFYIVELHPALMMFEFNTGKLGIEYSYFFNNEPFEETVQGTYADMNADIRHKEYFWNHGMGETVTALLEQGLRLEFLHEFPFSHYGCFPNMTQKSENEWFMTGFENLVPLMYSIKAKKV